ncbi:YdcF family protein [Agrobacterium tumefaciens]|nr:YdcF family protein [Agrobacterium tumefaciens]
MKAPWPGTRIPSTPVSKGRLSRLRISQNIRNAPPLKRNAFLLGLMMLSAVGLYGLALVSAGSLLVVEDPPARADVIVVLGGDGPPRAAQAAKLWHEGRAPLVLVTGYGDCDFIHDMLVQLGVDSAAVSMECLSLSTWENATFSQPILTGMRAKSAILVTSWFHSRRAVKRFRFVMPQIQWISLPAQRTVSLWRLAINGDGVQVFKEYAKALLYDLRSSFVRDFPPVQARLAS